MFKRMKHRKLITLLLVLSILLMSTVVLASCTKEPEIKMYNVEVTSRQFIGIETLDVYISAVNGLPLEEEDTTGSFKEGSNVEISMRINNRISAKDYKFIVRDGEVKLKELQFPENRYVIENLSKWEKLNVELIGISNNQPDPDDNTDPNEPEVDNICYYQIRPMQPNGSQIIDPIEGRIILGQSFTIKAPNFTEKGETQHLVKQYRFSQWGTDSDMEIGGRTEQSITVTPTSNEKPLVFYANYIPLKKVELGKNAILNESKCFDKNGKPIPGINNYREKNLDGEISWYLASGDKISAEFLDETNKNRFISWLISNTSVVSYSYKLNFEVFEDFSNIYTAETQPQVKISTTGKTPKYILTNEVFRAEIPYNKKVTGVILNGEKKDEYHGWRNEIYRYNSCISMGPFNEDVHYELVTEDAFTVRYFNSEENKGDCKIEKYPLNTKTLTFTASPSIRKWRINNKFIDTTTNTLTLNASDISEAIKNDNCIDVEAIYNPLYTNTNGIIKEGVPEINDERMKSSFNVDDFKYRNLETYLPGLSQKQSLLTEGITRIPGIKNQYLMGGYVETNESNDSIVTQRKSVLFLMDDTTGTYNQSAQIRKTLLLEDRFGNDFTGKISGMTVLKDEILISCYDNQYIMSCSLDEVLNAGTFGIVTCEEKYRTSFTMMTSIFYNSNYNELMVAGVDGGAKDGESKIGIIKIETNPDPRETGLYNNLGMEITNGYFNKELRLAKRADRSGILCVQGIGMNLTNNKLYMIIGPNDNKYKDNNRRSEIYCMDYLIENDQYIVDMSAQTKPEKVAFKLPPLMREFYIDSNSNGKMAFLSIGASYTRYIEPTDATQCQFPISKLLTILVSYL